MRTASTEGMADPKAEPRVNVALPRSLHARIDRLRSKVDSPYGRPSFQALVADLLRGAVEQAEKKARA